MLGPLTFFVLQLRQWQLKTSRKLAAAHAVIGAILLVASTTFAQADALQRGAAAFVREDYVTAARVLKPLAQLGNAGAQARLGFMYATGRGVPQSYVSAAKWYYRAADQGNAGAQYMLGLMYDKGQGVQENIVEAHKWLNLASAHAARRDREYWVRIRDAVASKMTIRELAEARWLAHEWRPVRERLVVGR
jgi:TPR repeat protein